MRECIKLVARATREARKRVRLHSDRTHLYVYGLTARICMRAFISENSNDILDDHGIIPNALICNTPIIGENQIFSFSGG